ncbi:MAG: hypothetical protein U0174_15590 [Polyangiaceae bacterium]
MPLIGTRSTALALDTNLFFDLMSPKDLNQVSPKEFEPRRLRSKDALLMGVYLHRHGLRTLSLARDIARVLPGARRVAGHEQPGDELCSMLFGHYVIAGLLAGWKQDLLPEPDGLRGSRNDDLLLAEAQARDVAVITNEGYLPTGTIDPRNRMHKEAAKRGVVLAPASAVVSELQGFDVDEEAKELLARYDANADEFSTAFSVEYGVARSPVARGVDALRFHMSRILAKPAAPPPPKRSYYG